MKTEVRGSQQSTAEAAEEIRDDLRSVGLRITKQRLALLRILEESGEHLDAQALHARARRQVPNMSLATVYRNLQVFMDAGLVNRSWPDSSQSGASYETTSKEPHCHFRCLACQRIVEMPVKFLDGVKQELAGRRGASLIGANLVGYCANCRRKLERLGRDYAEQGHVNNEG
jgi:Fe2+ or Zn2+ uptake regulation protein